jgi:hypothetical protein
MPSNKLLRWGLIAVIWVVVSLALLEIVLRVAAPVLPGQLGVTASWVITGQPYAKEWTPAWQQNGDHYYILRPGLDNVVQYGSPTVSFSLSTIELWKGGGVGFRTRPIDYFVDAVVVGDSFGFCFTEREDCWVTALERETGMGIVNLSQPVTGNRSHQRILQDFGQPLQPPLVIWQFFGNDFNDDYGLAVFRGDIDEIPEPTSAADAEPESETSLSPMDWLRKNSVLVAVVEQISTGRWYGLPEGETVFDKPYRLTYGDNHVLEFGALYELLSLDMSREQNQIGLEYGRQAFTDARDLVDEWGGKLVVVMIPTKEEVYAHLTADMMSEADLSKLRSPSDTLLDLCAELDIACLDLLPHLQEHALNDEALYYVDDMHLNPYGNTVMANILHEWLAENDLLPE